MQYYIEVIRSSEEKIFILIGLEALFQRYFGNDKHNYMDNNEIEAYLLSGSRANKKRKIRYARGKQKVITSKEELEKFVQKSITESGKQTVELSLQVEDGRIVLVQVVSKSVGSICLKTVWKVDVEKYNKIYKKQPKFRGEHSFRKHHAFWYCSY